MSVSSKQSRTQLPPPSVALASNTGVITQPWYQFFSDVYNFSGVSQEAYPQYECFGMSATAMQPGATAPSYTAITGTTIRAPVFPSGGAQSLHGSIVLPKGRDEFTGVYPYVLLCIATAAVGTVGITFGYAYGALGESLTAGTQTLSASIPEGYEDGAVVRAVSETPIDLSNIGNFLPLPFSIARTTTSYTGDIHIIEAGVVVQKSLPGTVAI